MTSKKLILNSAPQKILLGYTHKFSIIGATDENYLAYEFSENPLWVVNEEIGTIEEDGSFTPHAAGTTAVTANISGLSATTYCTVVDTVDISASDSITIKSEEELEIPVTLSHEGTAVSFTKDQLTWEVEGNIGEFVSPGKFKAAILSASSHTLIPKSEPITLASPTPY